MKRSLVGWWPGFCGLQFFTYLGVEMKIPVRIKWFCRDRVGDFFFILGTLGHLVWFLSCVTIIFGIVGFGAWGFLKVCHVF
jgi:hypothetical protein